MLIRGAFLITLIVLLIVLLNCAVISFMKENKLARIIAAIDITIVLIAITDLVSILTKDSVVSAYHKGLCYAFLDWLIMWMLSYAVEYTKVFKRNHVLLGALNFVAVIDSIMLFFNGKYGYAFDMEIWNGSDFEFFRISHFYLPFLLHVVLFYTTSAFVIICICWKMHHVGKFYRPRYRGVLIWFGSAVLMSILCLKPMYAIDLSILWYCIVGISIFYFTFYYMPKGIVEQTLKLIQRDAGVGTVCFDADDKCIYVNDAANDYYNLDHDLKKMTTIYRAWLDETPEARLDVYSWAESRDNRGEEQSFELHSTKLYDDDYNYVGRYFTIFDRTQDIHKYNEQRFKATHDSLTGLYNRDYFFELSNITLMRNTDKEYCMVVSNIRDFKLVNELFGMDKGDDVIIREAEEIKRYAPEGAVYGRLYGDRFAMLIDRTRLDEERFMYCSKSIQNSFANDTFKIQIMVGVYEIFDRFEAPSIMCDKAFLALSSLLGRRDCNIAYYDASIRDTELYNAQLENDFESAIAEGQFCFYLQPQMTAEGKLLGAEALVRWNHPKLGFMNPSRFVEVFENSGQIYRLDEEIWRQVAEKLAQWKEKGRSDLHISVNISAKDFYFMDIYSCMVGLVERYGINPINMKLEITETALINDFAKTGVTLNQLRQYGFEIEIDDFGSGYSSLNMLKNIDADVIKMDMEFLREAEDSVKSRGILATMIGLCKSLGMSVVTEGVETAEQVEMLRKMNNDIYQGYYFSRPLPVEEFEQKYL